VPVHQQCRLPSAGGLSARPPVAVALDKVATGQTQSAQLGHQPLRRRRAIAGVIGEGADTRIERNSPSSRSISSCSRDAKSLS